VKKTIGSILTLFSVLAALLIGGAVAAQANTPASKCENKSGGLVNVNVVVCEIDIDDNDVIVNLEDIKVSFLNDVLSDNDIDILTDALDNLTIDIDDIDVDLIDATVEDVLNHVAVVLAVPCGCPH
jgi:hypothetical protein